MQSASKAGFVITPLVDKKGHFQAQKLGQIEILVRKPIQILPNISDKVFENAILLGKLKSFSAVTFMKEWAAFVKDADVIAKYFFRFNDT